MKDFKETLSYVLIIFLVLLIRTYVVTPVRVDGSSMYPNLSNNDILLLKKYDKSIERFDVVVINYGKTKLVKRVIGLPGETIKISISHVGNNAVSKILINGEEIKDPYGYEYMKDAGRAANEIVLGDDEYFVLGDNRNNSTDSRIIGKINKKDIFGVTNFRIFPFSDFGKLN